LIARYAAVKQTQGEHKNENHRPENEQHEQAALLPCPTPFNIHFLCSLYIFKCAVRHSLGEVGFDGQRPRVSSKAPNLSRGR